MSYTQNQNQINLAFEFIPRPFQQSAHCFLCTKYISGKRAFWGGEIWWRMRADSICSGPLPALAHRSEEQSELCLKGDDTHRNVNGAEYFRGGIITWQEEDGWVSRKHLAVEVPLCYCKPGVKDDFNAQLTRPSCCRGGLRWLSLSACLPLSLSLCLSLHTEKFKLVAKRLRIMSQIIFLLTFHLN